MSGRDRKRQREISHQLVMPLPGPRAREKPVTEVHALAQNQTGMLQSAGRCFIHLATLARAQNALRKVISLKKIGKLFLDCDHLMYGHISAWKTIC